MENFKFYRPIVVGNLGKPIGSVENGFLKIKGVKEKIKLVRKEVLDKLDEELKKEGWVEEGYQLCNLYFEGVGRKTTFRDVLVKEDKNILENNENTLDVSDIVPIFSGFEKYRYGIYEHLNIQFNENKTLVMATSGKEIICKEFNSTPFKDFIGKSFYVQLSDLKKCKTLYLTSEGVLVDNKRILKYKEMFESDVKYFEHYENLKTSTIREEYKCTIDKEIFNLNNIDKLSNSLYFMDSCLTNKDRSFMFEFKNNLPQGDFLIEKKLFKSLSRTCKNGDCEIYQYEGSARLGVKKKGDIYHFLVTYVD